MKGINKFIFQFSSDWDPWICLNKLLSVYLRLFWHGKIHFSNISEYNFSLDIQTNLERLLPQGKSY